VSRRARDRTKEQAVSADERRGKAFRLIAVVMAVSAVAFGVFTAVFGIISEGQRIHAIHNTVVASLLLVLSAPGMIVAARTPDRSTAALMHLAMIGVAGLATMAISLTLDPFTLPFVLLVGVLWLLRPGREPLLPTGRVSPILLVLVLAASVPLVAYSLDHAELQRIDSTSEHAQLFHWVEMSFYAVAILLLGLLAALRPATYRLSATCAGVALAILGAGSLLLEAYVSALETSWAWAALTGGLVFVAAAEWEARRASQSRPG
jgi:MFS family permease